MPFFYRAGSDFEELYVGVGARRMRALFQVEGGGERVGRGWGQTHARPVPGERDNGEPGRGESSVCVARLPFSCDTKRAPTTVASPSST